MVLGVCAAWACRPLPTPVYTRSRPVSLSTASWDELEARLPSSLAPEPLIVDSVLVREKPALAEDAFVLYRERNGWCPYSERVWLALYHKGIAYETVLIDNTGGGRPSWYSGDTPQVRWPDGTRQKESLDVVKALDAAFPDVLPLWPPAGADAAAVSAAVSAFRATFPRNARPSSRAAFLFEWDGDPLPRSTFERTLDATEVQRCGYTAATLWPCSIMSVPWRLQPRTHALRAPALRAPALACTCPCVHMPCVHLPLHAPARACRHCSRRAAAPSSSERPSPPPTWPGPHSSSGK